MERTLGDILLDRYLEEEARLEDKKRAMQTLSGEEASRE